MTHWKCCVGRLIYSLLCQYELFAISLLALLGPKLSPLPTCCKPRPMLGGMTTILAAQQFCQLDSSSAVLPAVQLYSSPASCTAVQQSCQLYRCKVVLPAVQANVQHKTKP